MFWHVFGRFLALLSSGSLKTRPQPRWQSWVFSMITWWPWIVFPWWPSCLGCRWPKSGWRVPARPKHLQLVLWENAKPMSQRIFANAPEIVVLLRRISNLWVFGGPVPQPLLAFPALCTRGTLWLWSSSNGTEWGNICYINSYGIIYKHNTYIYNIICHNYIRIYIYI